MIIESPLFEQMFKLALDMNTAGKPVSTETLMTRWGGLHCETIHKAVVTGAAGIEAFSGSRAAAASAADLIDRMNKCLKCLDPI